VAQTFCAAVPWTVPALPLVALGRCPRRDQSHAQTRGDDHDFDAADVSSVIADLDVLLRDFRQRIGVAERDYLDAHESGCADEKLEKLVCRPRSNSAITSITTSDCPSPARP
jgi:hypothetical protein